MYMDLPPFRHVQWITDREPPRLDLAWSNIKPDWKDVVDIPNDHELLSASDPNGDAGLISFLSEEYDIDPSRIMLTNGCSEANFLAMMSYLTPGSTVIVEKPVYTPLIELPRAMGCTIHTIKRRAPDFLIDIEELKQKTDSLEPDLVVLQNLNNPTGKLLEEHDLEDISRVLQRRNIPVLVDEVYRDFAMSFMDSTPIHAAPSMVQIYDKGIITSSVTKVYGGGGLVTGWMIGPKRTVNKARRMKIYSVPMVNHWGNRVALSILKNRHRVLPDEFEGIRKRSNLVSTWAKGRDDVRWSEPDGCAVGFLTYDHDIDSIDLCEELYKGHDVRVIPGAFFHQEKGFRISLASPYDVIKEALVEIDSLLDGIQYLN